MSVEQLEKNKTPEPTLVGWVGDKVEKWEKVRDDGHKKHWDEYYRLWRGIWSASDKTRQAERSRIIAPALQQAIEASVAEMEESIFHRKRWIDIEDDVVEKKLIERIQNSPDQDPGEVATQLDTEMEELTSQLIEDFELSGITESISEILLNGALYGTGIGKIVVDEIKVPVPTEGGVVEVPKIEVGLVAIDPREFVIDPAATRIHDALGAAHVYTVPRHEVQLKQAKGVYRKGFIGGFNDFEERHKHADERMPMSPDVDNVEIIEYHGLVPKDLYNKAKALSTDVDPLEFAVIKSETTIEEDFEFVEVIVWIANRGHLLKISDNPFILKDRSFISFQYDTVPNRFWGRGVAEKGYNPQKALDAEMRARIDALGLSTYPMMVVNGAQMPRNADYQVRPGRNLIVQGNVGEAIQPFKFPAPDPQSYRQSAELERMVTVATGAMDTAAPLGVNPRNETASGISMMLSATLKRAKRTLRNIERQLLTPLVNKVASRYMQFDPEKYPIQDYRFRVFGALGAQAREFEVAQLTQLLQTQQPESTGYFMLLKAVLSNYNIEDKDTFMAFINEKLVASMNPQPPQPDFLEQAKLQDMARKDKELDFKIQQAVEAELRKDSEAEAEAIRDRGEAIWNTSEAVLNVRKSETERVKAISDLVGKLIQGATKEGNINVRSLLSTAEQMVDQSIEQAAGSEELEGLHATIARQVEEEAAPGLTER